MEKAKTIGQTSYFSITRSWLRARSWFETCSRVSTFVFSLALYLFLTLITVPIFYGDSVDYADSIMARSHGKYYEFWEFGHVLWRPLGWVTMQTIGLLSPNWGRNEFAYYHVIFTLIAISWLAGFATVYLFQRLACSVTKDFWCASLGTVGFATAQAFLNFVQAGPPYMAGLAMLMLGIHALALNHDPVRADRKSVWGGIALAGSVLLWFSYVFVMPAVILIPLVKHRSLRRSLIAGFVFAIAVGGVYLAVIVGLGLHAPAEVLAWVRAASHGIQIGGFARAVFGFARSFINMGNDGILFKRFLLRDPFNPVSVMDLFRTALVKLGLFYLLLVSVVATLVTAKRQQVLVLLTIAAVPVLFFAFYWQGGDLERYLPLYPFLFLALAVGLAERPHRINRFICVIFVATMAVVNIFALSRRTNALREEKLVRRARVIPVPLLGNADVLFLTHTGDELANFSRSFPLDPLNGDLLHVRGVIDAGQSDLPMWKSNFGGLVFTAWERQGNVWVTQRVFSPAPKREWNWVEHDDPRISWRDLGTFFLPLEYKQCVGEDDGFCLLAPSPSNRKMLSSVMPSPR